MRRQARNILEGKKRRDMKFGLKMEMEDEDSKEGDVGEDRNEDEYKQSNDE